MNDPWEPRPATLADLDKFELPPKMRVKAERDIMMRDFRASIEERESAPQNEEPPCPNCSTLKSASSIEVDWVCLAIGSCRSVLFCPRCNRILRGINLRWDGSQFTPPPSPQTDEQNPPASS